MSNGDRRTYSEDGKWWVSGNGFGVNTEHPDYLKGLEKSIAKFDKTFNREVSVKKDDLVYWYKMDKRLPPKSGKYLVAFSSRNFNYDVDEYDANTGLWDFYNKEDMVKVKWWMEIPNIFEYDTNE